MSHDHLTVKSLWALVLAFLLCTGLLVSCVPGNNESSTVSPGFTESNLRSDSDGGNQEGSSKSVDSSGGKGKTSSLTGSKSHTSSTPSGWKETPLKGDSNMKMKLVTDARDHSRMIAICSVKDFGAKGDGISDDTKAFTDALQYARDQGGGTVWAPAGRYVIKGNLSLHKSVFLAGVWYNPDTEPDKIGQGTVLLAMPATKGNVSGRAFISVGASAGLIGITVFYPEQNVASPVVYPNTIRLHDTLDGVASGFTSLYNVTLINPYYGVAAGDQWNELHLVNGLYMSPIKRGFYINMCTDVGRLNHLNIGADYWAAYDKSVSKSAVTTLMKKECKGLIVKRTDYQNAYDVNIRDCNIGISSERNEKDEGETAGGGQFSRVSITNCVTGINIEYNGFSFNEITIQADGNNNSRCINVKKTVVGTYSFYNANLSNAKGTCISIESGSEGVINFQNSTFQKWGSGHYAVEANGGSIQILNTRFNGAGKAIYIGSKAMGALLQRNQYAASVQKRITNENSKAGATSIQDSSVSNLLSTQSFALDWGKAPVVSGDQVVLVTSYGAKADSKTDCTAAFQKAIDEVKKAGGGIVYVPSGSYLLKGTLKLPQNVELRGANESMHHTTGGGTYLLTTAGEGQEDGTPFITMEAKSSLRGITVWYPEQKYNDVKAYPWTIRVKGQDVSIRNICFGNAYRAIDMASYDCGGHYLENVTGCNLRQGIAVDKSSKKGYILNCHFNPHFFFRTNGTGLKGGSESNDSNAMFSALLGYQDKNYIGAFKFGKTTEETVFNTFNYRSNTGLILTGGFDGLFYGCGMDGAVCALKITGSYSKELRFINFVVDTVPGNSDVGNVGMHIDPSNNAKITFVNAGTGSYNYVPPHSVVIKNGIILFQQFTIWASPLSPNAGIDLKKGSLTLSGGVFNHVGPLNSQGAFLKQSEASGATDIRTEAGTTLDAYGITAKYFYKAVLNGTVKDNNYVIAQ